MESDTGRCWCCGREPAQDATAASVPMCFVRYRERGRTIYTERPVVVPRGRACALVDRAHKFGVVKIPAALIGLGVPLAFLPYDVVGFALPIAVAGLGLLIMAASGLFVRGKGARAWLAHPEVIALRQQGWIVGPYPSGGLRLGRRDQRQLARFGAPVPGEEAPPGSTGRGRPERQPRRH